tara:strand:- start:425 stop:1240 length:816 start_codon:yes stop_codon:yes gene_type:complete
MKIRHNKKRNTAFVYEALIREGTAAILKKDTAKRQKIIRLIREHFKSDSVLHMDLECYKSLYESQNMPPQMSEKILKEAKLQKRLIDPNGLFSEQSKLIDSVNKEIGPDVFNNFVPNYKTLATIAQIFSDKTPPKDRIILENQIVKNMSTGKEDLTSESKIDEVVYSSFVKKFNEKYDSDLLAEQKQLLTHYISSFMDNSVSLKVYLNNEIPRLKEAIKNSQNNSEFLKDDEMLEKSHVVLKKLDSFSGDMLDENILITILKTQQLVEEML